MIKSLLAATLLVASMGVASTTVATAGELQTAELSIAVSDPEIKAGASVTVSTVLTLNGSPAPDRTVTLWRRPYGAAEFSVVATEQTNGSGVASRVQLPETRTHYKWTYDGDATTTSAVSPWATVKVFTVVTLKLRDDHIYAGQRMVATGTTTPNKAGAEVHLWRKNISDPPKRWLTRTVRSDGTFRFAKRIQSTNAYRLFAVVPATSGNLKGTSETLTLFISA